MSKATDRRTAATRAALIESAETLFARHGVDGISLRQIATASGSANTNVVAYHFGSKQALVEAVIHHRLPAIEARRAELLAALPQETPAALCDVLWRPFLEQTDEEGRHTYAAFLAGLFRSNQLAVRAAMSGDFPVTQALLDRIGSALPKGSAELMIQRLAVVTLLVTGVLQVIDENRLGPLEADARFADAIAMSAAALCAPSPSQSGNQPP